MKEITKEDVLKAIKTNKIKNKEISNKIATIAIKEIFKEDKQLQEKIDEKMTNNKESNYEQ